MQYPALKAEIDNDPLARNYAGMTDDQLVADSLNAVTDTRDRSVIPAHEVFEAMVPTDMAALTDEEKGRLRTLLAMGSVNIQGGNTRSMLGGIFGGTATAANLVALQSESVSRAANLGFPVITEADVARVRV